MPNIYARRAIAIGESVTTEIEVRRVVLEARSLTFAEEVDFSPRKRVEGSSRF
jgi:hypothetical protein